MNSQSSERRSAGLRVHDFSPATQLFTDSFARNRNHHHHEKGAVTRWLTRWHDSNTWALMRPPI
jgi:hypothetical protein